jgi:hypothetical protein
MKKFSIILITFWAFFLNACESSSDDNEKIFSCKIDGSLWVGEDANEISGYTSTASLDIINTNAGYRGSLDAFNAGAHLQIILNNIKDTGIFMLTPNDSLFKGTEFTDKDGVVYRAVSGDQSFLKLTQFDITKVYIDTTSYPPGTSFPSIVGSFNIIVKSSDGKIKNITGGKFDLGWTAAHLKVR